jgi:small-conductance mechanosensitive channel
VDFSAFLATPISWWDALFALLAVLAGWISSRVAKRAITGFLGRVPNISPAAVTFAGRLVQYTLLLLGIGVALAFLGANVQPLLAVVIVALVVVVLVLRGVADNFAASVIIQSRKPVVVGEEITVEGPDGKLLTGVIVELNSRAVVFETFDGRTAHVPNGKIVSETFTNNSRKGMRRSEIQVRIEHQGTPVEELVSALTDAAASVDGVRDPERVTVIVVAVSPKRLTGRLQFWHDPREAVGVTSRVVRAVSALYADRGLEGTATSDPGLPPLVPSESV